MLDLAVVGAIANKAKIVVYFAPNTEQGYLNVINHAVHDPVHQPSVILLSWTTTDDPPGQSAQAINEVLAGAATMGVTICVASGEGGLSGDGRDAPQAFPATSPVRPRLWRTASGPGRTLHRQRCGLDDASGRGVSRLLPVPEYQAGGPRATGSEARGRSAEGSTRADPGMAIGSSSTGRA